LNFAVQPDRHDTALLTFAYGFEKNVSHQKRGKESNENWRNSTRL
jgi:hypothetical protein